MTNTRFALPALALMALAAAAHAQGSYTVVDMGTLGGQLSEAYSVNDSGQATGYAFLPTQGVYDAFLYTPGVGMADLGSGGGTTTDGIGINNAGQVVGQIYTKVPGGMNIQPFLTVGGVVRPLAPGGVQLTGVTAINGAGQIAGSVYQSHGQEAVLIGPQGTVTDLGNLGVGSSADAVSPAGFVTGSSQARDYKSHTFLYAPGVGMTDLGVVGGEYSIGTGVNDAGQVCGYFTAPAGNRAFFSRPGVSPTDMGTLGGATSAANAINSHGLVVGRSDTASGAAHAFVANGLGGLVDLNSLIGDGSGWVLGQANGISDTGYIVGVGQHDGYSHAFLLIPAAAPEPSQSAALGLGVLGLAGLGVRARRRVARAGAQG